MRLGIRSALSLTGLVVLMTGTELIAEDEFAFFEQRVRPILIQHCGECHGDKADSLKGGLSLNSKAGWERGGDSGQPAIVPGDPEASLLIQYVRHDEPGMEMPPEKPRIPDAEIADLVEWVRSGAPDPRLGETGPPKRADKSWWSLQPLGDSPPPEVADAPPEWKSNPIDRFVTARLHETGLSPNPPADRRTLIRRVTYGLTGLPPTPEECAAFESDPDPLAYEKLVDRLLESPRYGEHWGRHWLDVVRFGESRGFERNEIINDAWPFRDYVIRSFNDDKPFNQFIVEHLAGDVVAAGRPEDEIGVAFLTLGPYDDVGNQDPVAAANIRAATVDDMVTATGSAFLGLTINCARCHHHKFDPIPTEDYYRIKAALDGAHHGSRQLATAEQRERYEAAVKPLHDERGQLDARRQEVLNAIVARADEAPKPPLTRPAPSAHETTEAFEAVPAKYIRFTILATTSDPGSGVNGRLDEFEVWTAGDDPRNVALASAGAAASGETAHRAEDFAGAYGIELVNDGKYGSRWFAGSPPVLTITLPRDELIDRVTFSHDRTADSDAPIAGQGPAVADYELHVSIDGQTWQKVADSSDRRPFNEAIDRARKLRTYTTVEDQRQLDEINRRLGEINAQIASVPPIPTAWVGHYSQPDSTTKVFKGGDPQQATVEVAPSSLNVLEGALPSFTLPVDAPEAERRLALAQWIASDENPLTARVLVNRLWHYHFGTGIVDTPGDFGFLGGEPTHPALLDWLSHRLHEHGWKLKSLHREIVLSQTYQQAGTFRESAADVDRDSRLLWRFPPRRLTAEEVRDTMLAVAGKLDLRMGGPGFRLYQYLSDNVSTYTPLDTVGPETYRRAVYHQNARASVVDVLSDFDLPDNAFAAPKRGVTTTPLQALTMLNHSFTLDMAGALTERAGSDTGGDTAETLRRLYQMAYQREPLAEEREAGTALAQEYGLEAVARAVLNSNELFFVE